MTDNGTIIALSAILGLCTIAAIVYGTRYQKRRRAERLRRRGYKEYNRGRPKRWSSRWRRNRRWRTIAVVHNDRRCPCTECARDDADRST